MSNFEAIVLDRPRPNVLVATLNRPDRLNALTFRMFDELYDLATMVGTDDTVRALVLTGAGRAFCAGLDLGDAATLPEMSTLEFLAGQETWSRAITAFQRVPKPVIAAVNGAAAGAGFSLALTADIRIAAPAARFNAAFIRIGLTGGDCGSTWTLPRIVGLGRAYEILLTGRFVDAEEAAKIGLVNRVVPTDELMDAALDTAALITANSPLGVRLTKQALHQNVDAPSLAAAVEVENRIQTMTAGTSDMREAFQAFAEKRPPVFTGR